MTKTTVEEFVSTPEGQILFQRERAIESVTDIICELMEEYGVSRSQLAKRLKMTPGRISQILDGEGNRTLYTLSDVFVALGRSLNFYAGSLDVQERMTGFDTGPKTANVFTVPHHGVACTAHVSDFMLTNTASSGFIVTSTKATEHIVPSAASERPKLTKKARFTDDQFSRNQPVNDYICKVEQE